MQIDFVWTLLISLGLTELMELGLAYILGLRNKKDFVLMAMVNVMTNPAVVLLNALLTRKTGLNHFLIVAFLETAAIVIEGAYYKNYAEKISRPFLFSLETNAFSYTVGLVISHII